MSAPETPATPGQAARAAWEARHAGMTQAEVWDGVAQAVLDARTAEWTHDPLTDIPPGELVHLLSLVDLDEAAEANYEGYRGVTGNRSAVTGQTLPEFPDQRELIRQAWRGGASMVISMLADKLTEQALAARQPQPAPGDAGCPDPGQHVVIRDFLTGRELSHAETDGTQPAPGVWTVAECLERISDLAGALHEIKNAYAPGTFAHDLAHATLDQRGPTEQPAPELQLGPCPFDGHDGEHLRLNTHGHWLCAIQLTNMLVAAGVITDLQPEQPAPELAAPIVLNMNTPGPVTPYEAALIPERIAAPEAVHAPAAARPDLGTAWRLLNETRSAMSALAAEIETAGCAGTGGAREIARRIRAVTGQAGGTA